MAQNDVLFTGKVRGGSAKKEVDAAEEWARIFDAITDLVSVHDVDYRILRVNRAFSEFLGRPAIELVGKHCYEVMHNAEMRIANCPLAKAVGLKATAVEEIYNPASNAYWMVTCSPIYDEQGNFTALVHIIRDVTKRRRAEEALRSSEKQLSKAQRIAHIGSWNWDIVDNSLTWSEEIYRIFGLDPRSFGATYEAFLQSVHPDDRHHVRRSVAKALEGGNPYSIDHRIVLPDDSIRTVHEDAEVTLDASGRAISMDGTVHDITDRKMAEDKVQRQLENVTALRDIGIAISSSLDLRVTLNILLEKLIAQLGVDAADVLLPDQNGLYLNYAAGRGFRTSSIRNTKVRMGKGHAGRAAFERQTLIIPNLSETLTNSLRGEGFESYVAMPLIAQGRLKGVLETFHRKALNPTAEWLDLLELLSGQAAIAIDNATMFESLQRANTELVISYDVTLEGWGRALEFRDADTKGHTERVTETTVRLARLMGVEEQNLVHVRRGALLHDIGKISVPDNVLMKPGPLTQEEQDIMKRHPVYAYELLSAIPFLRPAIDIPYCHHERWDGSGYPRGLREEQIPINARIFSVVDVADALTSDRPYRRAWSVEKTYDHIKSLKGIHFDPEVVDAFINMKWK